MTRVALEEGEAGTLTKSIRRCDFCRGFHPDRYVKATYMCGSTVGYTCVSGGVDNYVYHSECADHLLENPPPTGYDSFHPIGRINYILGLIRDARDPNREVSFPEYAYRAATEVLAGRKPDNIPGSSKWEHLLEARIYQLLKK